MASTASKTLSSSAQMALREVFRRFDREHLKKLQNYLNSPSGILLNSTTHSFGNASARSNNNNANTNINTARRPRPFGTITEGIFLKLFAAAGTLDPIRAAFVVSKLGYRPNFSVDSPKPIHKIGASSSAAGSKKNRSNRPSAPPGRKRTNSSSKSSSKRPASAGARRRPAGGKRKSKGSTSKRPSTAGARRGSNNNIGGGMEGNNNSSFLRGAITPRHGRGPMDFYWKFLAGIGGQLGKKK